MVILFVQLKDCKDPEAVKVMVSNKQIDVSEPANKLGIGFTCTSTESEFWQPFASVTFTEYIVVESGTKLKLLLTPPLQIYSTPPLAFKETLSP